MINRREILGAAVALPLLPVLSKIETSPKLDILNLFKKAYQQNIIVYDKDARGGILSRRLIGLINSLKWREHTRYDTFIIQGPISIICNANEYSFVQHPLRSKYEFISQPEFFGDCDIFFSLKQYNKKYLGIATNSNQDVMMFMY